MVVFIHCAFVFFSVVFLFRFLCVVFLFCFIYLRKRMSVSMPQRMYGYTYTPHISLHTYGFMNKECVTTYI